MSCFRIRQEGLDELVNAISGLRDRLGVTPRDVIRQIAEHWANEVFPRRVDQGGARPWPPLSPVSIKLRGPSRPLQGRGRLRSGFHLLFATDRKAVVANPFGAVHQFGATTGEGAAIPGVRIPARPFMTITDEDIDDAMSVIERHYFGDAAP